MRALLFTDPHVGFSERTYRMFEKKLRKLDHSLFDIVIISGDWGATKINHVESAFKLFRKHLGDKVILGVLGNHDLWDKKLRDIFEKFARIERFAKESNIHLLEKNPYEKDGFLFVGFNGWYFYDHSATNDLKNICPFVLRSGEPIDNFLNKRADDAVNFILDLEKKDKKVISVTHFPCIVETMDNPNWNGNPKHGELLLEFSELIIFGHTHKEHDGFVGNTRVINVGNHYNKLDFKIVDLNKLK